MSNSSQYQIKDFYFKKVNDKYDFRNIVNFYNIDYLSTILEHKFNYTNFEQFSEHFLNDLKLISTKKSSKEKNIQPESESKSEHSNQHELIKKGLNSLYGTTYYTITFEDFLKICKYVIDSTTNSTDSH